MKLMVTGAGGMLAHALLPALAAGGHEALALARADADVTRADVLRRRAAAFRPDWVVNLAAYTDVDGCESAPDRAFLVNGLGARNAALAAADAGAGVLTVSTDYVFDGRGEAPWREHDAVGPLSVYGRSKLAGERAATAVNPRHLLVRTAWLYGRGGRNFVDTILARARAGSPLRVVDDQLGSPTWTGDLAPALIALMERREYGTYHVTNAGETTWYRFAVEICERAGIAVPIEAIHSVELGRPARRPAYSVLHNGWYEQVTGRRMPEWRDALARHLADAAAATGTGR